jgi:hypothetical protein
MANDLPSCHQNPVYKLSTNPPMSELFVQIDHQSEGGKKYLDSTSSPKHSGYMAIVEM